MQPEGHHPAGEGPSDSVDVSLRVQSPCILWAAANHGGAVFTCLPRAAIHNSSLFQDLLAECGTPASHQASSTRSPCGAGCSADVNSGMVPPSVCRAPNGPGGISNPCPPAPTAPTVTLPVPPAAFAAWLSFVCMDTGAAEPAASGHMHTACGAEPAALRQPRLLPAEALQGVLQVADLVIDMRTVEVAARMLGAALFLSPTHPSAAAVEVRRNTPTLHIHSLRFCLFCGVGSTCPPP